MPVWANGMGQTDRQTDGRIAALFNVHYGRGIVTIEIVSRCKTGRIATWSEFWVRGPHHHPTSLGDISYLASVAYLWCTLTDKFHFCRELVCLRPPVPLMGRRHYVFWLSVSACVLGCRPDILWPSDSVTRESSDPETQLTRWPFSIMNSKCRLMCRGVRAMTSLTSPRSILTSQAKEFLNNHW